MGAKPSSRVCLHRLRRRPATKARRESVLAGATTRSRLCLHRPLRRQTTRPRREAPLLRRRHTVRLLLQERPRSRMCPHRQRQGPRRATTVRRETLLLLERGPALACACTAHGGCLHRPRGRQATVARTEVALAGARLSSRVCRYRHCGAGGGGGHQRACEKLLRSAWCHCGRQGSDVTVHRDRRQEAVNHILRGTPSDAKPSTPDGAKLQYCSAETERRSSGQSG